MEASLPPEKIFQNLGFEAGLAILAVSVCLAGEMSSMGTSCALGAERLG